MTNEQTIAVFKNMIRSNNEHGNTLLCIGEVQALEMAIEALSNSQNQSESLIRTSADSVSEADVIYRQDAIEELRDVIVKDVQFGDELTDGYNDGIDMAITVISKLPSAQPESRCNTCRYINLEWYEEPCDSCTIGEGSNHYKPSAQPEIIRCKDCKKYDTHDHRCKHWNHGVVVMDWCSRAERRTDE